MSEDDNTPYRQTAAYKEAAARAAEQNKRQRKAARTMDVQENPDEPWGLPALNVIHMEVNSPIHPFDDIRFVTNWKADDV